MDDTPDYIIRAKLPAKRDQRYPPRVRQPGPEEGQDFFTLTERHGRPVGVFEQHYGSVDRKVPYRG